MRLSVPVGTRELCLTRRADGLLCSYEAKLSAISTGDEVSSMVDEEGVVEVSLKVMQDVLARMRHSSDTMAGYRGLLVFMLVGLPPSPAHTPW